MRKEIKISADEAIDKLESILVDKGTLIECPLKHTFLGNIYVREIFMPAGATVTSRIHATLHPFFVTMGACEVWIEGTGWELIAAPHSGVTQPGTRRVLKVLQDTFWITTHFIYQGETLEHIEERIWQKRDNPLLSSEVKEKILYLKGHDSKTKRQLTNV